jgi:hypothetical protein
MRAHRSLLSYADSKRNTFFYLYAKIKRTDNLEMLQHYTLEHNTKNNQVRLSLLNCFTLSLSSLIWLLYEVLFFCISLYFQFETYQVNNAIITKTRKALTLCLFLRLYRSLSIYLCSIYCK